MRIVGDGEAGAIPVLRHGLAARLLARDRLIDRRHRLRALAIARFQLRQGQDVGGVARIDRDQLDECGLGLGGILRLKRQRALIVQQLFFLRHVSLAGGDREVDTLRLQL